jgi:hypothetical protein
MNRPGYKTTEFMLSMLGVIMVFYLMVTKLLSTEVGMPYLMGLITTYAAGRVGSKSPGSGDEPKQPGTTTETTVTKIEPADPKKTDPELRTKSTLTS